VSAGLAMPFQA